MIKEYDVNYSVDYLIKDNPNLQKAVSILIDACVENSLRPTLIKYDSYRDRDFKFRKEMMVQLKNKELEYEKAAQARITKQDITIKLPHIKNIDLVLGMYFRILDNVIISYIGKSTIDGLPMFRVVDNIPIIDIKKEDIQKVNIKNTIDDKQNDNCYSTYEDNLDYLINLKEC